MKSHRTLLSKSVSSMAIAVLSCAAAATVAQAQTALPVVFPANLDAAHLRAGQAIEVRSTQAVTLSNGLQLPKGTRLAAHVVAAEGFTFDNRPYAEQKGSRLSIRFDSIEGERGAVQIHARLRAMAAAPDVRKATTVEFANEADSEGTLQLIGAVSYSPRATRIAAADGATLAYQRHDGIFARLSAGEQTEHGLTVRCAANQQEQAVGIFSGSACGVYGFGASYLSDNGAESGTISLNSGLENVRIERGSAALLEVSLQ